MISEFPVGGIYVAPIVIYAAVAFAVFLGLRALLGRAGVLGFVWHAALFELSVFLIILCLLVRFV